MLNGYPLRWGEHEIFCSRFPVPRGRRHITGNRCERGPGGNANKDRAPNMVEYKQKRMFDYPPLEDAPRGIIGIPRVLNLYET